MDKLTILFVSPWASIVDLTHGYTIFFHFIVVSFLLAYSDLTISSVVGLC
jgi:hypothetical protein